MQYLHNAPAVRFVLGSQIDFCIFLFIQFAYILNPYVHFCLSIPQNNEDLADLSRINFRLYYINLILPLATRIRRYLKIFWYQSIALRRIIRWYILYIGNINLYQTENAMSNIVLINFTEDMFYQISQVHTPACTFFIYPY